MHQSGAAGSAQAPRRDVPAPPRLRLSGIAKTWPGAPAAVLDGVDLGLAPGELLEVSGRNGAGKTTLLRIAAGLLEPDCGDVEVQGRSLTRERAASLAAVSFLSADGGLYSRLTARQHLDWWARLNLLGRRDRARRSAEELDFWRLGDLADRPVQRLSRGQQQRVRLALAFLPAATVVLLDEPAASLDDHGLALVREAVATRLAAGAGVIWSAPPTHPSPGADRTLVVDEGRLREVA